MKRLSICLVFILASLPSAAEVIERDVVIDLENDGSIFAFPNQDLWQGRISFPSTSLATGDTLVVRVRFANGMALRLSNPGINPLNDGLEQTILTLLSTAPAQTSWISLGVFEYVKFTGNLLSNPTSWGRIIGSGGSFIGPTSAIDLTNTSFTYWGIDTDTFVEEFICQPGFEPCVFDQIEWGSAAEDVQIVDAPVVITTPPGLNPGDPYRLAFITKDKIFFATSPNIADYDALVTAQANTSTDLAALGTNWRVIGSTSSVDAKGHTETDDSPAGANGVPIYRLDGVVVANDYDDLWDGSIQNPLYVAQDGTVLNTCCGTWTGTRIDGTGIPGDELGAPDLSVVDGAPNGTASNWVQTSPFGATSPQYLYAISDVLTVFDPTVQVGIDVKPGTEPGCGGAVPVAILGSDTLDVTQIDPATLSYEGLDVRQRGNGSLMCRVKDVNGDGYDDFLCQYQDTTTDGMLTGELLDGTPIEGVDTICVVN